ncbi:uncharacterized protein J3R85_000943 [Psidium guajava]|nr:uncharacterized protein J3R85_000943 [Psidium guajava]
MHMAPTRLSPSPMTTHRCHLTLSPAATCRRRFITYHPETSPPTHPPMLHPVLPPQLPIPRRQVASCHATASLCAATSSSKWPNCHATASPLTPI